jgi:cell division protein FtsQ
MRRGLRYGFALVAVLALVGGGWVWLRESSLVGVREVEVTGVTASEGDEVKAALESAAREMTTLHVREEVLRHAIARYSSVADLRVRTDFPHGMSIEVIEREPVAALSGGGARRVAVTGSGVLLRGVTPGRDLPSVLLDGAPAGPRVTDRRVLRALAVAGAAPAELRRRSDHLEIGARGVVVVLDKGPDLIFGNDADAAAKWIAAARVLAEPSAAGATYLDLRIPGRVAAGGLAPIETPDPNLNLQPEAENSPTLNP